MDKVSIILIGFFVLLAGIYLYFTYEVLNAKTPEELMQACQGFTVKDAPMRCLEGFNK